MILDQLRQHTAPVHQRLESRLNVLRPDLTRADYLDILRGFYGWYVPLETLVFLVEGWSSLGLDMHARRKVPLLTQDLITMGMTQEQMAAIPHCPSLPQVETLAQGLGCLYVLEGATLGGRVIERHFQHQESQKHWSTHFFGGYHEQTSTMWKRFSSTIAAYATDVVLAESMVASAQETFLSLEQWLMRQ